MIRTVLSLYIALTLLGAGLASAAPADASTPLAQTAARTAQDKATTLNSQAATAQDKAPTQTTASMTAQAAEVTCAPPTAFDDFTYADWAYVTRDENSTTYLRMDTIKHTAAGGATISCGDIKKTYTKHGLTNVYHSLKATDTADDESLALLHEIDYAIMHVSYRHDGTAIAHRLHQTTFYNKSGNSLITFDFDDIALQTGTNLTWEPVTSRMNEEIAIFCRLANG